MENKELGQMMPLDEVVKLFREDNIKTEIEILGLKEKIRFLSKDLIEARSSITKLAKEKDKDWIEICKLKDKIYDLQANKDGLIEFVKKQRNMLMHSEDEIARLNDENTKLKQNISALGVTFQENDQAYYKLMEANAFLAGKVQAYEHVSRSESEPDPDAAETAF